MVFILGWTSHSLNLTIYVPAGAVGHIGPHKVRLELSVLARKGTAPEESVVYAGIEVRTVSVVELIRPIAVDVVPDEAVEAVVRVPIAVGEEPREFFFLLLLFRVLVQSPVSPVPPVPSPSFYAFSLSSFLSFPFSSLPCIWKRNRSWAIVSRSQGTTIRG